MEVWFAVGRAAEAVNRVDQKNKITRRWAKLRNPAIGTAGSADGIDRYLRCDLPRDGSQRRAGPALVQHRGDGTAPRQDRRTGDAGQALRAAGRSGRVAHLAAARRAGQHHHRAAARLRPGALIRLAARAGRERLAVYARQLALEPGVRIIHSNRQSLLRRLEQTGQPALARHEHRPAAMGAGSWALSPGISRYADPSPRLLPMCAGGSHPACVANAGVVIPTPTGWAEIQSASDSISKYHVIMS